MKPAAVWIAQAASVILAVFGLSDFLGITRAVGAGNLAVLLLLIPLGLLVYSGEDVKSRLLNWARERWAERGRKKIAGMAYGMFFFLALLSVCLSHQGVIAGEKVISGPEIARLDIAVARASAEVSAKQDAEAKAREREDRALARIDAEIGRQPDTWSGARERERLRRERTAAENSAAGRLRPYEDQTAVAKRQEAEATAARAQAPLGFASLAVILPIVGAVAFVPWLLAAALEMLTGFVAPIATPRKDDRPPPFTFGDLLQLDPAGLELISDRPLIEAIRSKCMSISAKAGHVLRSPAAA